MKLAAVMLILLGSGLVVFGLSGFNGDLSANPRFRSDDALYEYSGYFQWPMKDRLEITFGMISFVSGVLLRKNSN